jgi:hypothetical protein
MENFQSLKKKIGKRKELLQYGKFSKKNLVKEKSYNTT